MVEHGRHSFYARIRELHPALYEGVPAIKARWSPALSIVALGKIPHDGDGLNRLARQLEEQTVVDFEILFRGKR